MGKWSRRAFITTAVMAGGTLAIGIGIRPGDRRSKVAGLVAGEFIDPGRAPRGFVKLWAAADFLTAAANSQSMAQVGWND